jgi:tetratricopeptide (TPR) repeat protein
MHRSSYWLATALIGTNVALVQQVVVAKSVTEIGRTAQAITVEIRQVGSDGVGSGILLQRQGDVYTVLTAGHVVKSGSAFALKTVDGKVHQSIANSIKSANSNIDLAVLKFRSNNNYSLAKIGASSSLAIGAPIYVGGFPAPTYAVGGGVFNFTEGRIIANANRINPLGYSLIYSNPTLSGMSGGPVLNEAGELVAIHGLGDRAGKQGELEKLGRNLGIVMETFGSEAVVMGVQLDQQITSLPQNQALSASDYFVRASSKYDQKDYKGAIADYTEVIKIDPSNASAYHNRGLAKSKERFCKYSERANTVNCSTDYLGAITDYNKAIYINPGNTIFYSNRADAFRSTGKYQEAINDYTKAIEINPSDSYFYFQRGSTYGEYLKDKGSAIRDYKISESKMNPSISSEYSWRGYIRYQYLQRYQGAINDYTKAIELDPGNAELHRGRALVYVSFKKDLLAIADYTKAIYFDPDDPNQNWKRVYHFERGSIYQRLDKYPQAIADYKKSYPQECVHTDGYTIMVCEVMGIIKLDLGDNQGAFLNFDQIIKEGYSSPKFRYLRGLVRQNLGDREGGEKDYRSSIEMANIYDSPSEYESYLYRGLGCFGLGQAPRAIANFTEAIKLEPNNPEAYHHRGVAYQALKDRNNAIKDLQIADRLYLKENRLNKHRIVTQLLSKI